MAEHLEALPVPLDGVRAARWTNDGTHVGVKEGYVIARVDAGFSECTSRGRTWTSGPGSVQLQAPGDVCRDVPRGRITRQIVTLRASLVEEVVPRVRVDVNLAARDDRGAAFRRLHDAVARGDDRLEMEVALAEAIAAIAALPASKDGISLAVRRAMDRLRDDSAASLTLDALASHAGVDKFRLCRAFRAQVGLPPHAYRTRLRVIRAKELLADGVRPSEVASHVGFYDQSQLHRHFARIVGTTPGRYARLTSRR